MKHRMRRSPLRAKMLPVDPTLLSKPLPGERLIIYLSVSTNSASAVLIREKESRQHLVYYISKAMADVEKIYPQLEKLDLALVMASRKLKPYFQSHNIIVVTSFPRKNILSKPDISGRLANWPIKLGEYDLMYEPRTSTKSQVLVYYIVDFSVDQINRSRPKKRCSKSTTDKYSIYTDFCMFFIGHLDMK